MLLLRQFADKLAGVNAVHIRHLDIHQNNVERLKHGALHRLMPAFAQHHMLNHIFQQRADKLQVGRVIIHGHHRHRHPALIAFRQFTGVNKTTVFQQQRHQTRGRHWFQQAGAGPLFFQHLGVDLGVARQGEDQAVRQRRCTGQLIVAHRQRLAVCDRGGVQ